MSSIPQWARSLITLLMLAFALPSQAAWSPRPSSNNQDSFAYFHHDQLQTPLQATDKAGNVVWAASYNAFGKASITTPAATPENPTITVNLRLPGQYLDEDPQGGVPYLIVKGQHIKDGFDSDEFVAALAR
jgi:RHS protein